jgi:hypothetical protein
MIKASLAVAVLFLFCTITSAAQTINIHSSKEASVFLDLGESKQKKT